MANFCLVPKLAEDFKAKIKSGEIEPEKLIEMTSAERHAFFSDIVGESNAGKVNSLFESKLLLKHQQEGIINWAKSLTGLKPEVERDILARVNRMTEVLQPKELNAFLADLAEHKLGFGVTMEEASKIADLAKNVSEKEAAMKAGGDRMDFGRAKVDFGNYVSDLKNEAERIKLKDFKTNPGKTTKDVVSGIGGTAKSLKASLDNSAIFRQGWKTMMTNPKIWAKNAVESFSTLVKTFGGKDVASEVKADILSRPNYGLYQRAKLAVSTIEEDFPTSIQEKIPILGRAFKASEVTYTTFLHKMRADIFDQYIDIANKTGVELDNEQLQSMGRLVNSLTGRGNLGVAEPAAKLMNNVFFSPRKLKADLDFFTNPFGVDLAGGKVTPFARKIAAKNLLKVVTGTAAILGIADSIYPGSVEKDPKSSDFGRIKIGDTRFDVTAGMGSIITLATRLITGETKSNGSIKPLNAVDKKGAPVFGATTKLDLVVNFLENKLSPLPSVVKDVLKGQDFNGNKPTIKNEASNLLTPLPITNAQELLKDPNSANVLASVIADALGISTNTYAPPKPKKKK